MLHALFGAMLVALAALGPAAAQDDWAALEAEGAVLMMRHALAPGTGDPAGFEVEDCVTQRNLDAAGRAQAQRIGAALRERGITVDRVWTSQWCRCRDTATLMRMGPVTERPFLNSFFGVRAREPAQTAALRAALAELPATGRSLLVTHQVNITALTGVVPRSGEIVVLARDGSGGLAVTGRVAVAP